ncbi:MAG: SDR family NAD(P)-dependent oxidoreductase [Pseudomonadota bacterium]
MEITEKTVVLTGGTSGIGRCLVERLQPSNRLFVLARDRTRLAALAQDIPGLEIIEVDLADRVALGAAVETIARRADSVDLLINNAAVQYTPTVLDAAFDVDAIEREVAVNFTAVCQLKVMLLPLLQHSDAGTIVNVNSGLALAPKTTSAVYCATKSAMDSFSQSLRYQLEATPVSVLQAFLPLVDTPMTEGRGRGKMTAVDAADRILLGIERRTVTNDIGKTKLLRALLTVAPPLARRIMKQS